MKRDDIKIIIVVICVSLFCVGIVLFFSAKSNMEKLSYTKDYGDFFTVSNEVDNYLSYMSSDNKMGFFGILSSDFVSRNQIDTNSIPDSLNNYSSNSSFSSNGIRRVDIGKNVLYLVEGSIIENGIESVNVIDSNFMILVLHDNTNKTYAIYPVSKDDYESDINKIRKIKINKNMYNSIVSSYTFNDVDICKLYFSDYIDKLFNNIGEAYALLDKETVSKYSSLDTFKNELNKNKLTSLSSMCGSKENSNGRVYVVIDKNDNTYSFKEEAVMKYKVNINFNNNE